MRFKQSLTSSWSCRQGRSDCRSYQHSKGSVPGPGAVSAFVMFTSAQESGGSRRKACFSVVFLVKMPYHNLFSLRVSGPFGYNEEVEIRVAFSLPVTSSVADDRPVLSLIVGSTSTAKTLTYITAPAVYTTEISGNGSVSDSLLYFKYVVGSDDESVDLR